MPQQVSQKKGILVELKKLAHSKIVKNFFIYSFGSLLVRGISILFAPITMSILDPSDYGIIALSNSFVGILAVLFGLGLRGFLSMEYFHLDSAQRKTTINNIIFLYLAVSVPLTFFFCLSPGIINKFIFFNKTQNTVVVLGLLYAFFSFFTELFYNVLGYRERASKMAIVQIFSAVLTIGITLFFLLHLKWGVLSIIAGQLIGIIFVYFSALHSYFKTSCHLHIDLKSFSLSYGRYLKIGVAFIPGNLCGWILASADRWVLARHAGMHDVGIYSIAAVFGQLFQLLILLPTTRAYVPAALNKFAKNKKNLRESNKWNWKNMIASMLGLFVLISLGYLICKPILHFILPQRYQPTIGYIWLILMGYIFLLGEQFTSIPILFHKRVRFHALSLFVPSLLNLGLNFALVPYFNITGCILATLVSYACYFFIKLAYGFYLQKDSVGFLDK